MKIVKPDHTNNRERVKIRISEDAYLLATISETRHLDKSQMSGFIISGRFAIGEMELVSAQEERRDTLSLRLFS
jgi:hypothetical protein